MEEHLATRCYTIFPGIICDLSDEDERKAAVEWVLELLEEMGI